MRGGFSHIDFSLLVERKTKYLYTDNGFIFIFLLLIIRHLFLPILSLILILIPILILCRTLVFHFFSAAFGSLYTPTIMRSYKKKRANILSLLTCFLLSSAGV